MPVPSTMQYYIFLGFFLLPGSIHSSNQRLDSFVAADYSSLISNVRELYHNRKAYQETSHQEKSEENIVLEHYVQNVQDKIRLYTSSTNAQYLKQAIATKAPRVSVKCIGQLEQFLEGVAARKPWALSMIDALGKVPAGLQEGNRIWPGSYDECLAAAASDVPDPFSGSFCKVLLPVPLKKLQAVYVGVCVPDGCSGQDLENLLASVLQINGSLPTPSPGSHVVDCQPRGDELDWRSNLGIAICSIIIGLVVIGTAYDVIRVLLTTKDPLVTEDNSLSNGSAVPDAEPLGGKPHVTVGEFTPLLGASSLKPSPCDSRPGTLGQLLLAFSAYSNGRRILATGNHQEGTLPAIHGVRFLSLCWVVFGHTYLLNMQAAANPSIIYTWIKRFTFQVVDNAFFAVDSFFVLSGLLMVYLIMREREKKGRVNWLMFYIHRFWRLTPAYMLVLMVDVCLWRHAADGPLWPKTTGFEKNFCKDTWWTNLLYINNFVKSDQMCMGWSWYLAVDMQLFVISPLILIPLFYSRIIGGILMGALIVTHIVTNAAITHHFNLGTGGITDPNGNKFSEYLYFKPYCRVGPYVIGMITGYLLYLCKGKFKAHKGLITVMWLCAGVLALVSLYGLTGKYNDAPLPPAWIAIYNSFSRLSWSASLAWVVFACCTGHGGFVNTLLSWQGIVPLSRLTYSCYLVHILVLVLFGYSIRTPIYLTDLTMTCNFLAYLLGSFMLAFVTSLCFESPMMGLEKALWRK